MTLRVGLIGFGMMGRHHARVLSELSGVEYVGFFDPDLKVQAKASKSKNFESLEQLIEVGIDYAIVAVPTKHHLEVAMALADAGVHALIEKPLSFDIETSMQIAETFQTKGLIGAVGHIERFNPAIREAKLRLDSLGELYQVATRRQGPFPGRISDVGVVQDLASHDIDITRWVTQQDFSSLSAYTTHRSGGTKEDMLVSIASLSGGSISSHVVNWLSPKKERLVVLTGENGSFEIDTLNVDLTYFKNGRLDSGWEELARFRGVTEGDVVRFAFQKREPLVLEHENFRDHVLGKSGEIVSLSEGVEIVTVAQTMLMSSVTGKKISLVKS